LGERILVSGVVVVDFEVFHVEGHTGYQLEEEGTFAGAHNMDVCVNSYRFT
jgi:hypothetical protein